MTTTAPPAIAMLDTDRLVSWQNVRAADRDIAALAASITRVGILEPLLVVADAVNPDTWVIVAGNRRHAAAKLAGLETVPCIIRDDWSTQTALLEAGLAENLQRDPMTAREETVAFERLTLAGMSPTDIGRVAGRKGTDVSKRLSLLALPEPTRARVWEGQISMDEAEILAAIEDPDEQAWMEKFAGTTSFTWKRSQWKYEKARRVEVAEKKAAQVKEREEHKAAVAAAKKAGQPIPAKPVKAAAKKQPWQVQQEKDAVRRDLLSTAAQIANEVRVPWIAQLLTTEAKQKVQLPGRLRGILLLALTAGRSHLDRLDDDDLGWLGLPTNQDPDPVTFSDTQLILALALLLRTLQADHVGSQSWWSPEHSGPKLMTALVGHLDYPTSPEEAELATGLLGTDPPKTVRKPARRKPTVVQAGA
jgi:ParB/RepB/Spo0J family partition protein